MKSTLASALASAAAGALAVAAGAAAAQSYTPYPYTPQQTPPPSAQLCGAGPSITFYEGENFTGRQVTIYGQEPDLSRIGFNDRARSARTEGAFVVCENVQFGGRCERLSGSIRSLGQLGLTARISSARDERAGGYGQSGGGYERGDDRAYGGGYPSGYDNPYLDDRGSGGFDRGYGAGGAASEGVPGRSVVFYPRPSVSGSDIAARGQGSADQFCRASGHGPAAYYSQGERSRRAVDQDGRLVDAPVLRDVLCRTDRRVY